MRAMTLDRVVNFLHPKLRVDRGLSNKGAGGLSLNRLHNMLTNWNEASYSNVVSFPSTPYTMLVM